jgi:alpha-glucosidase
MWWQNAVIYEIYVRSFADSNADGVGDIPGITDRLDYLEWLGVDALWLTPVTKSPGRDHGYDVSDYFEINPVFGTQADLDRLITAAARRGIRIMLDLVPNHTSVEHPWFRDPRTRRNYYIWADQPNNWLSTFHIPCWTYDHREGRFYLHSYLPEQPDLDWWNEEVRAHFDDILRHWFDRGVAGFRIDACYLVVKDRLLRDNPVAGPDDHPWDRNRGQRPLWSAHRPELHDVLRRWRRIATEYRPERLLMGATWIPDATDLATFYGRGDELHLPQYFQFLFARFEPRELHRVVTDWLSALPAEQTPVWVGSTHDLSRFPSRWCDGDEVLVRTALTMLLTLPGTCVLYQGDELGLPDTPLPTERIYDVTGQCRDSYRTPMPWTAEVGGGFTTGVPWLPLSDVGSCNVAAQLRDPHSVLQYTRALIRQKATLTGPLRNLDVDDDRWHYLRGGVPVELDFRPASRR